MKNKKIKYSLLIIMIILFAILCIPGSVKASTDLNPNLYLGILEFRDGTTPDKMGYGIKNPETNGTTEAEIYGAKIWKIVRYNSDNLGDVVYNTDTTYYCVKAGVGFSDTKLRATYDKSYDFIKDRKEIFDTNNKTLQSIVTTDNDNYYGIIALANLMYIPESSSPQDKEALLNAAGIGTGVYPTPLTDDDIEAVQQAALWYFTNYDSVVYDNVYNQLGKILWFKYRTDDMSQYKNLSDYDLVGGTGEQREEQAYILYDYLVNTAKVQIQEYKDGTKTLKDKITLYANSTDENQQPVIKIEKEKPFDMALRKYITKVGNTELSDTSSRVPQIDESTIETTGTATYNHKKDPVAVKTGDIVTYNITVYNEGEKAGRVTKIVDQLPTGLTFKSLKTAGFTPQYDSDTNMLTITRDSSNQTNLPAYTEGTQLENISETIEIECEVTQVAGEIDKILTNVAWIAEEYNAVDDLIIINTKGDDRDSEPGTTPNVNKDNMSDYKGTTSETDLSKNIYYPGQQDDDDFEKLILKKAEGIYNLQIVKIDKNDSSKLQGASFKVTMPDGSIKEGITDINGVLDLGNIDITEAGTDIIKVEEVSAPNGYNKLFNSFEVEVTKGISNGKYVVTNVSIKNSQGSGLGTGEVKVEYKDGKVTITVPNEKKEGTYDLQIVKVDKNDSSKLQGASFKVTMPDGSIKEGITDINGVLDLGSIEITKTGTDIIKVEEVSAPNGYNKLFNSFEIEITKEEKNGEYVVTDVKVKNSEGSGLGTGEVKVEYKDGKVIITVPNEKKEGAYNLQIIKEDKDSKEKLQGASFKVTMPDGTSKEGTTNENGVIDLGTVNITNIQTTDIITIEEIKAPDGYNLISGNITVEVEKQESNGKYLIKNANITSGEGATISIDGNTIKIVISNERIKEFDLRLKKTITEVNGETVPERILGVDVSKLNTIDENGNKITDAEFNMNKEPVSVKKGDIVRYRIRVYNEGEIDGYASEISEDIPEGLEFMWSEKLEEELRQDETLSEEEIEAILYNQLIWTPSERNEETERIEMVTTNYLAKGEGLEKSQEGANLIKAYDEAKGYVDTETEKNPDYREVYIYMKVVSEEIGGTVIRNEAAVTDDTDGEGEPVVDRDSEPENWPGREPGHEYQDDEDYDNVILESFDLALRKFIIAVSGDETIEEGEYIREENGRYIREPEVDTSMLNTVGENGEMITTAIYKHPKEPVVVDKNDYVVYMLRVYNEAEVNGYATEITDYLPEGLDYVEGEFNEQYGWEYEEETRKVKTRYLENTLIEGTTTNGSGTVVLDYAEVPIMCRLNDKVEVNEAETNIAEITEDKDEEKEEVTDRDSEEDNVNVPTEEEKPGYKEEETGEYVPGQEDDDDFEKVIIKPFDLALRKFITQVEKEEIGSRVPEVSYDKEKDEIRYEHTKEPVDVVTGNVVTYTIRVYNEGARDGYAAEITDDIPEGLKYIPENETNVEYRWVMIDENGNETTEVEKAVEIRTDYLSKEQGEERMAENEELTENPALLKAFNPEEEISETNPDYADVKVAFEVVEANTSDKVIVNSAQISEDTDKDGNEVEDEDSVPDEWNEGEDDQDKEYIKLNYFDLSLRKWVTQAIVIENGKETVTQTGHTAEQDPEPIVKVDLDRKNLNKVTVKFRYSIRVTNEGDIAGYAKEIKDYIPEGLKFVAEDNPGWTEIENNVITTNLLADKLLEPGESAEVEVLLTWKNDPDNMGLKTNTAEISKDYNDKGAPDIDSTPDNKKEGEDDIDDAPVMLSIKTGQGRIYYTLGFIVLITMAGGIILIKKFVL